jgi:hypothetical protein
MVELVLTVCLLASPTSCREERPEFVGSLTACAIQGQFHAARWIAEHPAYGVSGWRCERSRGRQLPI